MKQVSRATSAAVIAAVLTALSVTPAAAATLSDSLGGAGNGAVQVERQVAPQESDGHPASTEPVPYVEAESPEDAIRILDAIEAGQSVNAAAANTLEASDGPTTVAAAAVSLAPCTLYPTVVYFRTSSDKGAVGFKPYTKCTTNVTSIRHESSLKYEYFGLWLSARDRTGGNQGVASYTQKDIEHYCNGSVMTDFQGTTLGTIVYLGKTYYSRVYTTSKELACTV